MDEKPVLRAETRIAVSPEQARAWFLSLADHPERYEFDSHAGFTFTEGQFGEPGARFETTERFYGLTQTLKFELEDVAGDRFSFRLLEPVSAIWGYFELQPAGSGHTRLVLAIGSERRLHRGFLKLPLIHGAVRQQIEGEVAHIKQSMESLYEEEERWAS
jgi:hypothetical protein